MTDAELTILSLLAEHPRYGHEIQALIDERGLREWIAIGFSSVFYILNKLEKQQMVTSDLRPSKQGAARKFYSLTEAGQGILQTRILDLLRAPRSIGSGFELGLANLHILKPAQVYRVLTHHYQDLQQQYTTVQTSWQQQQQDDTQPHIRALYTHSIAMMQADLAWLEEFLGDWRKRHPDVESELTNRPRTEPTTPTDALDSLKMIQRLKRPRQDDN